MRYLLPPVSFEHEVRNLSLYKKESLAVACFWDLNLAAGYREAVDSVENTIRLEGSFLEDETAS
jgi:hypothetical protein